VTLASALIVGTRDDYVVDDLVELLGSDPRIRLAVSQRVGISEAAAQLERHPGIGVIVLVCLEAETDEAVEILRRRHPHLNIVALTIGVGTALVSLPNPSRIEILEIVSSLLKTAPIADAAPRRGEVLNFPLPLSPRRAVPGHAVGTLTLPDHRENAIDAGVRDGLERALAWADAATQALLSLWNPDTDAALGLTLSWEDLRAWLQRFVEIALTPTSKVDRTFEEFLDAINKASARHTPLARIARLLEGENVALKLLLIVLAPELDIRFHRMLGVLHDDLSRRHTSVGIACAIVAATAKSTPLDIRVILAGLESLRTAGLVEGVDGAWPASDAVLRVHPTVVDWILSGDGSRLFSAHGLAALLAPTPDSEISFLPASRRRQVHMWTRAATADRKSLSAILMTGSHPGWLRTEAAVVAGDHLHVRPSGPVDAEVVTALVRIARLGERRLLIDLGSSGPEALSVWIVLAPMLLPADEPAVIIAPDPAPLLASVVVKTELAVVRLPPPSSADLRAAVQAVLATRPDPHHPTLAEELASRFVLPLSRMKNALAFAESNAAAGQRAAPNADDWLGGFRSAASARLPALARRIEPAVCPDAEDTRSCLDHVILPKTQKQQLFAILDHVRFGRQVLGDWGFGARLGQQGVSALFSGPSGTGKTLAAYAIASALGCDLYAVDLARITSKYIGETEKNLDAVFEEAEQASAVLLFDEADALFGKRSAVKDAHDRYANIEVAYLLQRLEAFSGVTILTTNCPENVDPAFTRRLRFSVEFPPPAIAARRAIWEQLIPKGEHRDEALDLAFLARRLELTGGSIRQIALHAAMAAAGDGGMICQQHLHEAVRTVLLQLGAFSDLGVLSEKAA
jgi:hypothetical protein